MKLLFFIGFLEITWIDIFDVLLVAILLYLVYQLLKGSVAVKILIGVLSIYLIYLMVKAAGMQLFTSILEAIVAVGVLAAIIIFQPEIRRFLLLIGRSTPLNKEVFLKRFLWKRAFSSGRLNLTPIIEATKTLGGSATGALIVFAKSSQLKFYAESGDIIDADISKRLLLTIFNKNSPLHDGAVIISNNRIKAARCILPISENDDLPASFGMRHRAAIGMTQVTDSVVLVVSEETGQLSITKNGRFYDNLSPSELRKKLNYFLYEEEEKIQIEEEETTVDS
ncbi:MAG: TIGR00159 family protein [Cytophagales bacterium]|nr:TIGR00159 family protein [Cytophagales bacterium]